jgi:chromosome segregation protein
LNGICGAIGELVRIPQKYETAIEIALGGAVQDIVTLTDADALAAIDFLRRSHEGRATFLPLDTIKPRGLGKERQTLLAEPGVLGTAKDLIQYDPQYEAGFANLLGGVIVLDNSAHATAFARKYNQKWPLVTLDGEMFSPGGPISGGSVNIRETAIFGRTRELNELQEVVDKLKNEASGLLESVEDIKAQLKAVTDEMNSARRQWQQMTLQTGASKSRCEQLSVQLESLNTLLAGIRQESERQTERERTLLAAIDPMREELRQTDLEIQSVREELTKSQQNISGDRLKRDEGLQALAKIQVSISGFEHNVQTCRDNLRRFAEEIDTARREAEDFERQINASSDLRAKKEQTVSALSDKLSQAQAKLAEVTDDIQKMTDSREALKLQLAELERKQSDAAEQVAGFNNDITRLDLRREQIQTDSRRVYDLLWDEYQLTPQAAKEVTQLSLPQAQLQREERRLKSELQDIGEVNVGAIDEYQNISDRRQFLAGQRDDILAAQEKLQNIITELSVLMENQFKEQFELISRNFDQVFHEMFAGGKACIKLTDEHDVLGSGIDISAQPPGKNLQSMTLLSGGERALTAAALLFAILRLKPSPFCILDEIEAALDEANVLRFARYIRGIAADTQIILITHRKGTMEAADVLYGVTMQEAGVSKLVSVKLEDVQMA